MSQMPIRTVEDHAEALRQIEMLWGADEDSEEGSRLELLVDLVEHFEEKNFHFVPATPIEIVRAHMEATGRNQSDLARLLGSSSRASEVLNHKRMLTVDMIHKLNEFWGIPADCLVRPYRLFAA